MLRYVNIYLVVVNQSFKVRFKAVPMQTKLVPNSQLLLPKLEACIQCVFSMCIYLYKERVCTHSL